MVMLSQLLRFNLVDSKGRRARLTDIAVNPSDSDYPPVTRFYFLDNNKQLVAQPWEVLSNVDWRGGRINVADLATAECVSQESLAREVLLRRDVLDSLVLDLQNRRATRANDLLLEEENGCIYLRAADTGLRAILRRMSRGRLGRKAKGDLCDWKNVEFLRGDPQCVPNGARHHLRITRLTPGEIAGLSEALPYLHAAELLCLLPDPLAADTLEAMTAERQLQVFEELAEERALRLLALISPEIVTDLLGRLQPAAARRYLERLPPKVSKQIIELLRYPEDTVGGIMTNDIVFAPAHLTITQAIHNLRDRFKNPDFIYYIYVVDDEESRRLRGVITLRHFLTAEGDQQLGEVMIPYVETVGALEPASVAAYKVIRQHLAALPVVGREGRLLGVVTVDAAVAQVAPASWSAQAPRVFS